MIRWDLQHDQFRRSESIIRYIPLTRTAYEADQKSPGTEPGHGAKLVQPSQEEYVIYLSCSCLAKSLLCILKVFSR